MQVYIIPSIEDQASPTWLISSSSRPGKYQVSTSVPTGSFHIDSRHRQQLNNWFKREQQFRCTSHIKERPITMRTRILSVSKDMLTPPLEATGADPTDVVGALVDAGGVGASVANEPWRYREPWDLDDVGSLERISCALRWITSRSSDATIWNCNKSKKECYNRNSLHCACVCVCLYGSPFSGQVVFIFVSRSGWSRDDNALSLRRKLNSLIIVGVPSWWRQLNFFDNYLVLMVITMDFFSLGTGTVKTM